eukprot:CAMPEP_0197044510 /NCGR_PEP_ID=MMETSP1384-20130603/20544_1 /TAXON_ID=29189 /ORGANISM="Ammonia sp." /LENGTH=100 /DNA_ID=CAMNT_0042475973 /DNA_START=1 /DNA_END=299 /DNA_ORIENTATION=-
MKLYKQIHEFDFQALPLQNHDETTNENGNDVDEPEKAESALPISAAVSLDDIKSVDECSVEQLVYIAENHVLNALNHAKLNENQQAILSCFRSESMDGAT